MLVCCYLIYYDDYFYTASANPQKAVSITQRITISIESWKGMRMYFILYNAEFEQFMCTLEIPGKMSCRRTVTV